jgi:hypothetical protein
MKTAQVSDLVEHLGQYNGLRFFRKPCYRFFPLCGATTVGLQVQDAGGWVSRMAVSPKTGGHIDHEQRPIRRIGHATRGDVHHVFQAPVRCGIPHVQLDVAP